MKPNPIFQRQEKPFWALVKLVSEGLGYSVRGQSTIKAYTEQHVFDYLRKRGLDADAIGQRGWIELLSAYSGYRADVLCDVVRPALMDLAEAQEVFEDLHSSGRWTSDIPRNKQSGDKAHVNFMSAIVNMLAERALDGRSFDSCPRGLVTVTRDGAPLRTLARRMDGAYPRINDPVAVWEVKEYYGTTTFGSRVADGIYETMLDGMELTELREMTGIHIRHYLIVDDRFTWWQMGRSYLCRIIDMLHDDLMDEVMFGRQVLTEWPAIVAGWPTLVSPIEK